MRFYQLRTTKSLYQKKADTEPVLGGWLLAFPRMHQLRANRQELLADYALSS